jgi:hypothetical protein
METLQFKLSLSMAQHQSQCTKFADMSTCGPATQSCSQWHSGDFSMMVLLV